MALATHLTIVDGVSNIIHELSHDLGVPIAPRTHTLNTVRYFSELAFDAFQGTKEDSTEDKMTRGRGN